MDIEAIKVYGAKLCGDCFQAKIIPDNHHIKYQWIDIEHDENTRAFVSQVNDGRIVAPTILFNDGSGLIESTNLLHRSK